MAQKGEQQNASKSRNAGEDGNVKVVREKTKKKEYRNIEEEMMDYLSNRQQADFHTDLTATKYSTGEDKSKFFQPKASIESKAKEESDEEEDWNKNKVNPFVAPQQQKMVRGDDNDDDDIFTKSTPAKKVEPPPPAKEKRVFGRAKKEAAKEK